MSGHSPWCCCGGALASRNTEHHKRAAGELGFTGIEGPCYARSGCTRPVVFCLFIGDWVEKRCPHTHEARSIHVLQGAHNEPRSSLAVAAAAAAAAAVAAAACRCPRRAAASQSRMAPTATLHSLGASDHVPLTQSGSQDFPRRPSAGARPTRPLPLPPPLSRCCVTRWARVVAPQLQPSWPVACKRCVPRVPPRSLPPAPAPPHPAEGSHLLPGIQGPWLSPALAPCRSRCPACRTTTARCSRSSGAGGFPALLSTCVAG